MDNVSRALPAPLTIPWWIRSAALYGGYLAFNLMLAVVVPPPPDDWRLLYSQVPERLIAGDLYAPQVRPVLPFVWSPVAGWIMAGIAVGGYWLYFAAHLAAVALTRNVRLIFLMLASWGFWFDIGGASPITFIVVSGYLALKGSRWAGIVNLALLLLMPRPLQVPLAVWLLWKRPDLRKPFVVLFAVHTGLVLGSGYSTAWITTMLEYGASAALNVGPTFWLGMGWMAVALPLAVWLTWRGHVGWAGLLASPYWLPVYTLMPFVGVRSSSAGEPTPRTNRETPVDSRHQSFTRKHSSRIPAPLSAE